MSENPVQFIFTSFEKISKCIQTNLSRFIFHHPNNSSSSTTSDANSLSLSITKHQSNAIQTLQEYPSLISRDTTEYKRDTTWIQPEKLASPVTKEDLGRATWTFLHTLGAQYPDSPTRQQKRDIKELMAIISRMYPCRECADHFKEVLRTNPVQSGSHAEFSQWLCHVHNVVNRSLGKLKFPCERVDARWGKLECEQRACDLHGDLADFRNERH